MMVPLLLGSLAVVLVAVAMGLWWGLATRVQQRAAASHADTRLSRPDPVRAAEEARHQRPQGKRWAELLRRAGLKDTPRTLLLIALPGIVVTVGAGLRLGSAWFAAFVLALYLLAVALWLYRRIDKMQQRLIAQMPDFLENMVRMAGIGNSLSMAFQSATQNVDPPLRPILDNALSYTRAGMDLDRALQHAAQAYRLRPLEMLAVILGTSIRIGGRSDQI
ncbi:MAG TPA: pilus assembly protein, partial [Stenotrophomonas sp.]